MLLYEYCQQATFDFGELRNVVCSENRTTSMAVGGVKPKSELKMTECADFGGLVEKVARPLFGCNGVFVGENIPSKKLANACKSMCVKESANDVALLVDSTIFGSAKDGLVITSRAVYFKNGFEYPIVVPWTKLETVEISGDGDLLINAHNFQTIGMEKVEAEALVDILKAAREWVSQKAN